MDCRPGRWKWGVLVLVAAGCAGCAAATSAPFHMYASPMLEDELAPPGSRGVPGASDGEAAGVLPAHVYVYRSNGGVAVPGQRRSRPAPDRAPSRAPSDSVTRPSRPALASYRPSA